MIKNNNNTASIIMVLEGTCSRLSGLPDCGESDCGVSGLPDCGE